MGGYGWERGRVEGWEMREGKGGKVKERVKGGKMGKG